MRRKNIKQCIFFIVFICIILLIYTQWVRKRVGHDILVAVVEEHHEVLPYWFDAVNDNILPRGGVSLIHIDGHSDEATPDFEPLAPFFHWPRSGNQVNAMMQKNDIFIQNAAMVGLLNQTIWIYPSWLDNDDEYNRVQVDQGFFWTTVNHTRKPVFCECRTVAGTEESKCSYINYTSEEYSDIPLRKEKCTIKTNFSSQVVSEISLLANLQVISSDHKGVKGTLDSLKDNVEGTVDKNSEYWISTEMFGRQKLLPANTPIIWDIDLDFFGCVLPGKALKDSGLTWRVVELFDKKIELLFCPHKMEHETKGDLVMKTILHEVIKLCTLDSVNQRCKVAFKDVQKGTEDKLTTYWKQFPSLFCAQNDLQLRGMWKNIGYLLYHLTLVEIEAILDIGFCFNFSPKTYNVQNIMALQICHGLNDPDTNIVQVYEPTLEDIQARMKNLENILKLLPTPNLVTVCRSSRDGYMPRKYFQYIEKGVLTAVKNSKDIRFNIWYDDDLLGGKDGWDGRLKVSV